LSVGDIGGTEGIGSVAEGGGDMYDGTGEL
jgi:hypothetical protein